MWEVQGVGDLHENRVRPGGPCHGVGGPSIQWRLGAGHSTLGTLGWSYSTAAWVRDGVVGSSHTAGYHMLHSLYTVHSTYHYATYLDYSVHWYCGIKCVPRVWALSGGIMYT